MRAKKITTLLCFIGYFVPAFLGGTPRPFTSNICSTCHRHHSRWPDESHDGIDCPHRSHDNSSKVISSWSIFLFCSSSPRQRLLLWKDDDSRLPLALYSRIKKKEQIFDYPVINIKILYVKFKSRRRKNGKKEQIFD